MTNWITENLQDLIALLLAFIALLEIVFRLTPSEKDNTILQKIKNFLDLIIPNFKKGGGKHE